MYSNISFSLLLRDPNNPEAADTESNGEKIVNTATEEQVSLRLSYINIFLTRNDIYSQFRVL